jgi:hypothetical protein
MSTKVECVCEGCDSNFQVYPSVIRKGGGKFCSRQCTKKGEQRTCPTCGSSFHARLSAIKKGEGRYCSRVCGNVSRGRVGEENGNWKGGRFVRSDGYVSVRVGSKYELEHRHIMEQHIGRTLKKGEQVHHLNEDKSDNRIENLELTNISEHISKYHPSKKDLSKWTAIACLNCDVVFAERIKKIQKNPSCFCSRSCYLEGKIKNLCK